LGFVQQKSKSGSSHAQWVKDTGGKRYKVTVDCPKAPFTQFLIDSMARQAGSSKREFYRINEKLKRGASQPSGPDPTET
jgi:predicted RNA binding protein YcfA (HicA-like mRNA interferase family)